MKSSSSSYISGIISSSSCGRSVSNNDGNISRSFNSDNIVRSSSSICISIGITINVSNSGRRTHISVSSSIGNSGDNGNSTSINTSTIYGSMRRNISSSIVLTV